MILFNLEFKEKVSIIYFIHDNTIVYSKVRLMWYSHNADDVSHTLLAK